MSSNPAGRPLQPNLQRFWWWSVINHDAKASPLAVLLWYCSCSLLRAQNQPSQSFICKSPTQPNVARSPHAFLRYLKLIFSSASISRHRVLMFSVCNFGALYIRPSTAHLSDAMGMLFVHGFLTGNAQLVLQKLCKLDYMSGRKPRIHHRPPCDHLLLTARAPIV